MSKWHNILRRCVSVGFLLLLIMYYANISLFCHTHIVNGVTLVHSHFHNRQHHNSDDGGHTVTVITFIVALTESFILTGAGILVLLAILRRAEKILRSGLTIYITKLYYHYFSLRAPPTKM